MIPVKEFLKKISTLRILVIGDAMLDKYMWGNVERISPEAPVPVLTLVRQEHRSGGAANVAVNLASLDIETSLATVVGDDKEGSMLIEILSSQKIITEGIARNSERKTTAKTRVIAKNQHVLRIDEEDDMPLTEEQEAGYMQLLDAHIDRFKPHAIIFEDYDKGTLTPSVIDFVVSKAMKSNIITTVDPKRDNFFAYKNVTLFKPNLREIKDAFNIQIKPDQSQLDKLISKLHRELNHRYTLVTLAENGIYYSNHSSSGCAEAHPRDIADVSGAGDTVIAVATAALAAGFDIAAAAELSNLAGGLVCEHAGVVPITPEMLLAGTK